jgi:hypothetical protein
MDACEPRPRHRGFFLHSSEGGESDTGEYENPEGFIVRVRFPRHPTPRRMTVARRRVSAPRFGGRSHRSDSHAIEGRQPAIRSGSVTGRRQRADLPR